ncbi:MULTISPECIES: hypothetical protein [Agrobacterium]|uniref:Uncharacterized protein n=1 Tax=Agrobacterium tumefaciens TaxID=358 RepID=A0A546XVK5_AGRTU|nr:hypothetical protein [Agrobacterium tumefaciens]TRB04790.1 hypothetical protein EXN61_17830 [Agrobacterium tumefaciens]
MTLIAFAIFVGWYVFSWLFRSILGLDKALASAIIAAFVAVFSLIFAYWKEREKARQEVHREKKVEVYSIFFEMVFRILKDSKKAEDAQAYVESTELQDALFELMKGVLAYGSPLVVLAMGRWKLSAESSAGNQILLIGDILLAMRKDLGLSNRGLTNINIHQVYVNDDVEAFLKGTN